MAEKWEMKMAGEKGTEKRGKARRMRAVSCICAGILMAGFWGAQAMAEDYFSGVFQASTEVLTQGDSISYEYPVLTGIDGFDQTVVDTINQYFYGKAQESVAQDTATFEETKEAIQEYNPDAVQYLTSEVTCGSLYIDGEIFSVRQDYYSYMGGAHGYGCPFGTTFSLRTGEELTMGGILGCDEATAQEAVVEAYRKEIIGQVENITEESIRGNFDIMEYWAEGDGMYVNIAPYGIASYAAGQQTALVTPEILAAVTGGTAGSADGAVSGAGSTDGTGAVSGTDGVGVSGSTDGASSGSSLDAPGVGTGAIFEDTSADVETITVVNGIQAPASDFIFPYSSTQTLTDADLTKLEGADVEEEHYKSQLAINEILARYGYVFHPENGGASKEAYDQFNGKDWYEQAKPYCPSDSANEMLYTYITSLELDNIDIICEWQKVHNCYY